MSQTLQHYFDVIQARTAHTRWSIRALDDFRRGRKLAAQTEQKLRQLCDQLLESARAPIRISGLVTGMVCTNIRRNRSSAKARLWLRVLDADTHRFFYVYVDAYVLFQFSSGDVVTWPLLLLPFDKGQDIHPERCRGVLAGLPSNAPVIGLPQEPANVNEAPSSPETDRVPRPRGRPAKKPPGLGKAARAAQDGSVH